LFCNKPDQSNLHGTAHKVPPPPRRCLHLP
ncbi:hypothetical protein Zm00014a_021075, partial [Zea mays]